MLRMTVSLTGPQTSKLPCGFAIGTEPVPFRELLDGSSLLPHAIQVTTGTQLVPQSGAHEILCLLHFEKE